MTKADRMLRAQLRDRQRSRDVSARDAAERGASSIAQLKDQRDQTIAHLKSRGWPGIEDVGGRAGWPIATFNLWAFGEDTTGRYFLLSNGDFCRSIAPGGVERFGLRDPWVKNNEQLAEVLARGLEALVERHP